MKARGKFISFLLIVDTFLISYAVGLHSRQVLVVDHKMKPVVVPADTALPGGVKEPAKTSSSEKAKPQAGKPTEKSTSSATKNSADKVASKPNHGKKNPGSAGGKPTSAHDSHAAKSKGNTKNATASSDDKKGSGGKKGKTTKHATASSDAEG